MASNATVNTIDHDRELNKFIKGKVTAETDLDDYLEKLLAVQRKKTTHMTKRFQAESQEWKAIKEQQKQMDNMISNDEWLKELGEGATKVMPKALDKVDLPTVTETVEINLAEEELLQQIEQ